VSESDSKDFHVTVSPLHRVNVRDASGCVEMT